MFRRNLVAFLGMVLLPTVLAEDFVQRLQADYVGKSLLLRSFCQDSRVSYDPNGELGKCHARPWTTSFIRIKSFELKGDRIEISGPRVAELLDRKTRRFVPIYTSSKMRIQIEVVPQVTENQIRKVLSTVFLIQNDELASLVPEYWRSVVEHLSAEGVLQSEAATGAPPDSCPDDANLDKPCRAKNVKPPKIIFAADPDPNELAVSAKIHGSCALLAVIDIDGRPKRLRISVPLGFGLDERAVEAVQHRSFQPATQRDKPVAVEINIEVNFRID